VTLTLYRDKRRMDVDVRLGESPINDLAPRAVARPNTADERLGIRVGALDARAAQEYGYNTPGGVVITDVQGGSSAEQRGMGPGAKITQINGRPVTNPDDVRTALDGIRAGQIASFELEGPDGRQRTVNVRMPAR
jgi:serine protease Do